MQLQLTETDQEALADLKADIDLRYETNEVAEGKTILIGASITVLLLVIGVLLPFISPLPFYIAGIGILIGLLAYFTIGAVLSVKYTLPHDKYAPLARLQRELAEKYGKFVFQDNSRLDATPTKCLVKSESGQFSEVMVSINDTHIEVSPLVLYSEKIENL